MLLLTSGVLFFFLNLMFLHNLVLSIFWKIIQSKLYGCTKKGKGKRKIRPKKARSCFFNFPFLLCFLHFDKVIGNILLHVFDIRISVSCFYGIDALFQVLTIFFLLMCLTPKLYSCENFVYFVSFHQSLKGKQRK
jgi:hypothetical protein